MPEVSIEQQPTPGQKPLNWKGILVTVAVIAVLVGLGVLIFLILQPREELSLQVIPKKATPSAKISTPSAEKNETADWKLYKNSVYNFSFKYPPGFDDRCCSGQGVTKEQEKLQLLTVADPPTLMQGTDKPFDGLSISVDLNPTKKSFSDYIDGQKEAWKQYNKSVRYDLSTNTTEAKMKVAGQNGLKLIGLTWYGGDIIYVPFPKDQRILIIAKNEESDGSFKEFDTILSTFRFE